MKYMSIKIIMFLGLLCIPFNLYAATIEIENKDTDVQEGDIVQLDVYLNSEDELNTAEGTLKLEGDYTIKSITTAGSVFDLWPNSPSYNDDTISFTGGTASSVFGNRLKLFSIFVKINSKDGIKFSSNDIEIFLNDGIGTKVSVDPLIKNFTLPESDKKTTDKFEESVVQDQTSPVQFEVLIGRDQNTYEGKWFASFNTVDKDSGIERYEVIENDAKTPVLTGTTYILQDQSLKGTLIVKAFDKAGNVQIAQVYIEDVVQNTERIHWKSLLIALAILLGLFFLSKKIKLKNVQI